MINVCSVIEINDVCVDQITEHGLYINKVKKQHVRPSIVLGGGGGGWINILVGVNW